MKWLTNNHEYAGSIPGTPQFERGLDLERVPPSLVRTIGEIINWEVTDLSKKVDIIILVGAQC